ncbi:MAG: hypothetical protein AAF581_05320 [Planctomycetota bacterium]
MKSTIAASIVLLCCSTSFAGTFQYQMSISDADATEGLFYNLAVTLTHNTTDNVGGWSYSICHDNTKSDVCAITSTQFTLDLGLIGPLFFLNETVDDRAVNVPGSVDGAAQGVVIDQNGFFFFPAGESHVVANVTYIADAGTAGTTSTTTICSTVGNPPVEAVVVCCAGTSVPVGPGTLETVDGTVTYLPGNALWALGSSDVVVDYDGTAGTCLTNCTFSRDVKITQSGTNTMLGDTAGFVISLTHDPAFLTATSITAGTHLDTLNGAAGADIFLTNIQPDGISVDCLNTMLPMIPVLPYTPDLLAWTGQAAFTVDYTVDTSSLAGTTSNTVTSIAFGEVGGVGTSVTLICGDRDLAEMRFLDLQDITVTLDPLVTLDFVRGDCNDTGSVNIADPIWLINGYLALPLQGPEGPCEEACDANSDGTINVADVSYLFSFLFLSGAAPAAPFPSCAPLPGAICDQFNSCP